MMDIITILGNSFDNRQDLFVKEIFLSRSYMTDVQFNIFTL